MSDEAVVGAETAPATTAPEVSVSAPDTSSSEPSTPSTPRTIDEVLATVGNDEPKADAAPKQAKAVQSPKETEPSDEDAIEVAEMEAMEPETRKALLKQDPELRKAWYDYQAFRDVFPTKAEARQYKELAPTLEILQEVSNQAAALAQLDAAYRDNPGDFAARLAQSNPQSFMAMLDNAKNIAWQADPQGYAKAIAEPVVGGVLQRLEARAQQSGNKELGIAIEIIREQLQLGKAEQPSNDPRIQRLQELEQQAEQGRVEYTRQFNQVVGETFQEKLSSEIASTIGKPDGLPKSAIDRISRDVKVEVNKILESNRDLVSRFSHLKRTGNMDQQHLDRVVQWALANSKLLIKYQVKSAIRSYRAEMGMVSANNAAAASAPTRKEVSASSVPAGNKSKVLSREELAKARDPYQAILDTI